MHRWTRFSVMALVLVNCGCSSDPVALFDAQVPAHVAELSKQLPAGTPAMKIKSYDIKKTDSVITPYVADVVIDTGAMEISIEYDFIAKNKKWVKRTYTTDELLQRPGKLKLGQE